MRLRIPALDDAQSGADDIDLRPNILTKADAAKGGKPEGCALIWSKDRGWKRGSSPAEVVVGCIFPVPELGIPMDLGQALTLLWRGESRHTIAHSWTICSMAASTRPASSWIGQSSALSYKDEPISLHPSTAFAMPPRLVFPATAGLGGPPAAASGS
jgi:hypothetical protein